MTRGIGKIVEEFLQKTRHRRPVVIALPIVLGLMAGGLLVIKPGLAHLRAIENDLNSLTQKESSYQTIVEMEKKLDETRGRFRQGGDKTWLIEQLNALANKTDISILSITPEESKKIGDYLECASVHVEAEAGYHPLGEFVSRVESMEPFMKILNLSLSAPVDSDDAPTSPTSGVGSKRGAHKIALSIGLLTPAPGAL